MKTAAFVTAAIIGVAGFGTVASAQSLVPGSDYYLDEALELERQAVASSTSDVTVSDIDVDGTTRSFGYETREAGTPAIVPGSGYYRTDAEERDRDQVR